MSTLRRKNEELCRLQGSTLFGSLKHFIWKFEALYLSVGSTLFVTNREHGPLVPPLSHLLEGLGVAAPFICDK